MCMFVAFVRGANDTAWIDCLTILWDRGSYKLAQHGTSLIYRGQHDLATLFRGGNGSLALLGSSQPNKALKLFSSKLYKIIAQLF